MSCSYPGVLCVSAAGAGGVLATHGAEETQRHDLDGICSQPVRSLPPARCHTDFAAQDSSLLYIK